MDRRSLFERMAAKVIYRVGCLLTPNTVYWMQNRNPFERFEDDGADGFINTAAVEHLAAFAKLEGGAKVFAEIKNLRSADQYIGDVRVTVELMD